MYVFRLNRCSPPSARDGTLREVGAWLSDMHVCAGTIPLVTFTSAESPLWGAPTGFSLGPDASSVGLVSIQRAGVLDQLLGHGVAFPDPELVVASAENLAAYRWMGERLDTATAVRPVVVHGQGAEMIGRSGEPGAMFWGWASVRDEALDEFITSATDRGSGEHVICWFRIPANRVHLTDFDRWDELLDEWPGSGSEMLLPAPGSEAVQGVFRHIERSDLVGFRPL